MSKLNGLPKYRPGIIRFATAELNVDKKARRFSIARIEGRLRGGSVWRVTDDVFTSNQADRVVEQLNQLAQERSRTKSDSCIVLNVDTLRAYLCPISKAKSLQLPDLATVQILFTKFRIPPHSDLSSFHQQHAHHAIALLADTP